jgi:hypothetical protein
MNEKKTFKRACFFLFKIDLNKKPFKDELAIFDSQNPRSASGSKRRINSSMSHFLYKLILKDKQINHDMTIMKAQDRVRNILEGKTCCDRIFPSLRMSFLSDDGQGAVI